MKTTRMVLNYLRERRAERVFIMVWIGVWSLVAVLCFLAHKRFAFLAAIFAVSAFFMTIHGAKLWDDEKRLIATGTQVWARITNRKEGRNFGDEPECASMDMEYEENGKVHRFHYDCRHINLVGDELTATEVTVIVDPEDWSRYYVDWTKTRGHRYTDE